ncbi:MAG: cation diffusion facilitator family transporter [Pseudomonadota bacterium]
MATTEEDQAPVITRAERDDRTRHITRVTLVGAAVDLSLGILKVVVGWFAQSQALIADGVHSFSDLVTDAVVIYAARHSSREADAEHPYGHGRFETMATVGLGIALMAVAAGISIDAIIRLFNPDKLWQPGFWALVVAGVAILGKEAIYHYSMLIARKYKSHMLKANAWHSRSDAISSLIVLLGVAGSMAGLEYLDAIAAIGVAYMIARIGWGLSAHSVKELVDTALEPERQEAIRQAILEVDGVEALHILRTRRSGSEALVDVHIQVDPYLSVSEAHYVSERVRKKVITDVEEVNDVTVHIDPENDEKVPLNLNLPNRSQLLVQLEKAWSEIEESRRIVHTSLHYLDGGIQVELILPIDMALERDQNQRETLRQCFARAARKVDGVKSVRLLYR